MPATFVTSTPTRPERNVLTALLQGEVGAMCVAKELLISNVDDQIGSFDAYRVPDGATPADAHLMFASIRVPAHNTKVLKLGTVFAPGDQLLVRTHLDGVKLTYNLSGLSATNLPIVAMGQARPEPLVQTLLYGPVVTRARLEELLVCNANSVEGLFELYAAYDGGSGLPADDPTFQLMGGIAVAPWDTLVLGFGTVLEATTNVYVRSLVADAPLNFIASGVAN